MAREHEIVARFWDVVIGKTVARCRDYV